MKFSSFAAVALSCVLTTVSAKINLAAPSNPVSGGKYTVTWTHDASDPAEFILMLQLASDSWATGQFWEFTQTKADKLDVVFLNKYPYAINPKSIYRLTARNQSNVDQVYSRSPNFQFLPAGSTVTSTTTAKPTTTVTNSTTPSTTAKPTTSTKSTAAASIPTSKPGVTVITQTASSLTTVPSTTSTATPETTTTGTLPTTTVQTTTQTSTGTNAAGETGGVLGDNTSAALGTGLSVSGGVAAVAAVLVASLASSFV